MGIMDQFFRRQKPASSNSAKMAKERLQIIIAHQRDGRPCNKYNEPEYMEDMKRDILEVVKRYVNICPSDVEANISKGDETDVLALNINLPDRSS